MLEITTTNMVGQALEVELYSLIGYTYNDWNDGLALIKDSKQQVPVNKNGKAELNICIEEQWELTYGDKGYLEIIPKINGKMFGGGVGIDHNKTNYKYRLKISPEAEKLTANRSIAGSNLVRVEKV